MTMFDKKRCLKCKYHGRFQSKSFYSPDEESGLRNIMCDYAKYAKQTCLHSVGREVVDRRGEDPKDCKLFEKGPRPDSIKRPRT